MAKYSLVDGSLKSKRILLLLGVAFGLIILALIIAVIVVSVQPDSPANQSYDSPTTPPISPPSTPTADPPSFPNSTDPTLYGQWQTVVPEKSGAAFGNNLGIQPIHVALLPSGKVLMVSGSSWRNLNGTQTYPEFDPPANHRGLYGRDEQPFLWEKLDRYYSMVNYNGIYDPEKNTYFRIGHPIPIPDPNNSSFFLPTDLFCSGHLHLPNGNVIYIGGTQYYYPYRSGARTTHIFDWEKEMTIDWNNFDWTTIPSDEFNAWQFSGTMVRGRWYPTMVPLLDGRMAVFSGFVGLDEGYPDMYEFEGNPFIEFFDSRGFSSNNTQSAWKSVYAKDIPNSPFSTPLEFLTPAAFDCTIPRKCEDYKNDTIKLYPHIYLLQDGRIYITGEGDSNSLRTPNTEFIRRTKNTYYMDIKGTKDEPQISFSHGPDRPEYATMSGTTLLDPHGEEILLLGGMILHGGTLLPGLIDANSSVANDTSLANQYAGSRSTRKLEIHTLPSPSTAGSWVLADDSYLGPTRAYDRTMHYAVILPTKQVLVVNGGNYDFYGPVYNPLLLTPIYQNGKFTKTYSRKFLNEALHPRLYHSTAVLLPDARVLVTGGNTGRATLYADEPQSKGQRVPGQQPKPNLDRVDLKSFQFTDSSIGSGYNVAPAENWISEIFSPPYLFIDGNRRPVIKAVEFIGTPGPYQPVNLVGGKTFILLHSEQNYRVLLEGLPDTTGDDSLVLIKLGSATHGWDFGQKLVNLPFSREDNRTVIFTTPNSTSNNIVPGYYMLFYVDSVGKPSVAQMCRFDDSVDQL